MPRKCQIRKCTMNNELNLTIQATNCNVFLQKGFYSHSFQSTKLHKHNHAEIHIVAESETEFFIDGKIYSAEKGNLFVIPRETSHAFKLGSHSCHNTAFQIDYPFDEFCSYTVSQNTVLDFLAEVDLCQKTGDHTKISGYVYLFCTFLLKNQTLKATDITDYGFLIEEFFSTKYGEQVRLSDLANILHLSSRQTDRLVIKHTGETFRESLCNSRIRTAKHLLENTNMTLSQICDYVGYQSYAGLYKALKKHTELL